MDKDIFNFFEAQLNKIDPTVFRFYRVAHYTVSHKQLILLVEAEYSSSGTSRPQLFITFEAVEYMQLHTSWKDLPLRLALLSEQEGLLERNNINIKLDSGYLLCYGLTAEKQIFIVCSSLQVTEDMPKLYEYTF